MVCADTVDTGFERGTKHDGCEAIWQIAARRSSYKALIRRSAFYKANGKIEKVTAKVRAKDEPTFRVIKR